MLLNQSFYTINIYLLSTKINTYMFVYNLIWSLETEIFFFKICDYINELILFHSSLTTRATCCRYLFHMSYFNVVNMYIIIPNESK